MDACSMELTSLLTKLCAEVQAEVDKLRDEARKWRIKYEQEAVMRSEAVVSAETAHARREAAERMTAEVAAEGEAALERARAEAAEEAEAAAELAAKELMLQERALRTEHKEEMAEVSRANTHARRGQPLLSTRFVCTRTP